MLSISLPAKIEKRFINVVQESYNGDMQVAITFLLKLHEKYGWKEQLLEDVMSIRAEVHRLGDIIAPTIDEAIIKYRNSKGNSNA